MTLRKPLICRGLFVCLGVLFWGGAVQASVPLPNINTNNIVVVTNAGYGAVGDGATVNTTAIQNAIIQAARGGVTNGLLGGMVRIPAGTNTYLCGPLNFSNNVDLQLDAGAVLQLLPFGTYPGAPYTTAVSPLITGTGLTNVSITGLGMIDGQGALWWQVYGTNAAINRPLLINFSGSSKALLQDFSTTNPPVAHIVVKGANAGNISFIRVHLMAPATGAYNTDGVDFAETNALFQDCSISTGDDNIAIGSSGSTSSDILVTNCYFGPGHDVSVGSYTSGGVSNLTVINCSFNGSGIKIKSERNRGGVVQNLNYLNLTMTNVDSPVEFYAYYEFGLGTLTTMTPQFVANYCLTNVNPTPYNPPIYRNILVSNLTATLTSNGRNPFLLFGLPDYPASNIVFKAMTITGTSGVSNPQIYNTTNVSFVDCTWSLPAGDKIQFWNASATFTNSSVSTNLLILDGLTTNGFGNTLAFYNATATLQNTNALDDGPLSLGASLFTVSNNLVLRPSTVLNFTPGTNATKLMVKGNLQLGGTNNIFAGPGFTNGSYTLMTYTGVLTGAVPQLGVVPAGYTYSYNTNTVGQVTLVVTLLSPTNLVASATNMQINLKWNAVSGATNYNLKRGFASGGPYPTVISGLTVTNYADLNVTNRGTYYYVVTAVGAGGESVNSLPATAVPLPSNQPTNLVLTVTGGQLQLAWPADHLGWRLEMQTNGLGIGLNTNWVTVSGSAITNQDAIPITLANGGAFFRLAYP